LLGVQKNYRIDIQALRGLAVLLVVVYHARLLPIKAGYLGVDIFFVISGFLITSQIANHIVAGDFSFKAFYYRRARRLLPAAYCVFAICLALSPWLLSSLEMVDFAQQTLGALSFTGNIVLWLQTGYFEQAAELKPLLHTWSLAIEEQYYLLLPLFLVSLSRRFWIIGAAVITLLSLSLYAHYAPPQPTGAFYLFPSRAWELGIGSLLALSVLKRQTAFKYSAYFGWIGLVILILVPAFGLPIDFHPAFNMLLVCLATVFVIDARYTVLENNILIKTLGFIGTISYSLYLVHWPIFSFLHNANVGGGGLWWPVRLSAVLLSFVLAYFLYVLVEQRFRLHKDEVNMRRGVLTMLAGTAALAVFACLVFWYGNTTSEQSHRLNRNWGLSHECKRLDFASLSECRNSDEPKVLVWGDSFAMHWVPGIIANGDSEIIQATYSSCAPITGVALFAPPRYGQAWAQNCIAFNQTVLHQLTTMPSVQVVILAAQWPYLINSPLMTIDGTSNDVKAKKMVLLVEQLQATIMKIRGQGKKVVVMAPPPAVGFNIGLCIERRNTGKISFGGQPRCQIPRSLFEQRNVELNAFLQQVSEKADVNVFSLEDELCNEDYCVTEVNGIAFYRDSGHLSLEGSIFIANKYQLMNRLHRLAR